MQGLSLCIIEDIYRDTYESMRIVGIIIYHIYTSGDLYYKSKKNSKLYN